MAVTLELAKNYLRVDGTEEDALIERFLETAESYMRNAISDYEENYSTNTRFAVQADLLKMVIVAENYNNRDGRNDPRKDFSFVIRSMVNQLQYFVAEESA